MDPLGQSQVLPYLEGLSRKGIKFYLVSLEKKADIRRIKELKEKLNSFQIRWYKLNYFKNIPFAMVFNILQCFIASLYLLIFERIKIIHARAYLSIFSILLLKKIFKTKLIFDMRGFWPEELVDTGRIKEKSIYYIFFKFLEKKSILLSDKIITLTPESKEIIEEKFKIENVEWMPTCVDENRLKNQEPFFLDDKFVMVYSGSLWSFYNMPAMMDFFNALKLRINNAHFLILGNNETKKLSNLFYEKGIKKESYTVLSLNPEDVVKYLLGSNLAINIIYDTYSKKASFPTKLAEYLICGLPIITNTQTNFIKEIVNYNKVGVVLNKFDSVSMNKAVDDLLILLEDKNLQGRCKKIAQEYLGKKVCIDKYMEIYQKIV